MSCAYAVSVRKSTKTSREADLLEDLARLAYTCSSGSSAIDLADDPLDVGALDATVVDPLPDLRARDLGGRGVLHQVVDRRGADALEPGRDVADPDGDVRAHARLGDLARRRGDVQRSAASRGHVLAQAFELVGPIAEHGVELGLRHRDEVGVRDPGAVEAVPRLARLVLADARQRDLVHLGIAPARDERRHARRSRARPRVWHVRTRSSVYARMNGTVIVTCTRSGSTNSGRSRNFLMTEKM